jgi:pilus assembly protein CpaF
VKRLALISTYPGGGRTFLAANLAGLLPSPVILLELCEPASSELALYLGLEAEPFNSKLLQKNVALRLLCLEPNSLPPENFPQTDSGWLLVDGLDLNHPLWESWLDWCGRSLLVERGDLIGTRRATRLVSQLEKRHFSRQGLLLAWTPSSSDQPLPTFSHLESQQIPEFLKTTQRLAQALPPSKADPFSPFAKSIKNLALKIEAIEAMPTRSTEKMPQIPPYPTAAFHTAAPLVSYAAEKEPLLKNCLEALRQELNLIQISTAELSSPRFRESWTPKVRQLAASLLARENAAWITREHRADMEEDLLRLVLGLGPLEAALQDESITEIMVNRHDQVYVEKKGKINLSPIKFWDDNQLLQIIERIVAPLGRRIDESSPKVDARLADGSRVNAIIPPLALKGPCLTVRKFSKTRLTPDDLIRFKSLSEEAGFFLKNAVEHRKNIVISGGTGSGKTTLLNVLSSYIPEDERIITVEDSAELNLNQPHVVSLESRPKNMEGRGEIGIRELVINCLRMRPDRIVVGECRGGEALDMLQAMNTGHDGSLTTVHANSSRDALSRIETLCLMSEISLPLMAVRRQLASAVELIVQVARLKDGSRRVTAITEVCGMEGDIITIQDIFVFKQKGQDASGRIEGRLEATGQAPAFYRQAKENGHVMDFGIFRKSEV